MTWYSPLMASPNNIAKLPRIKTGRRRTLAEIIEMQQVLRESLLSKDTIPSARAQVARAWDVLEERKRVIRMRPKPKDLDVSPETVQKRARDAERRRYQSGCAGHDPSESMGWDPDDPSDPRNSDCSDSQIAATVPQPDHSESRPAESPTPTAP